MRRKLIWALALVLVGAAAYGGGAMATPPSGVTNPPWSPVIGGFQGGIEAKAKTDVDPGRAKDWKMKMSAEGATDVHIVENIIAPGGTFGWHSHPGPSLVIVKSGTSERLGLTEHETLGLIGLGGQATGEPRSCRWGPAGDRPSSRHAEAR